MIALSFEMVKVVDGKGSRDKFRGNTRPMREIAESRSIAHHPGRVFERLSFGRGYVGDVLATLESEDFGTLEQRVELLTRKCAYIIIAGRLGFAFSASLLLSESHLGSRSKNMCNLQVAACTRCQTVHTT